MSLHRRNFTLTITNRWGKPVTEKYLTLWDVRSILALVGRREKDRSRTKVRNKIIE